LARAKFQVGDLARVGGIHRPLPQGYFWLRRGRIVRIKDVITGGHHRVYIVAGRRLMPDVRLYSFELRRLEDRDRRLQARWLSAGQSKD